jgi:glycosyltransferase involved in cell wall biosynthesis
MKIIYIANNWIADGSSAVYATYNVYGIARNQVETHLIVRNVSQGETSELLRSYFNLECPDNLTIHRIDKKFKNANIEYYWKAARLVRRLADNDTVVITRTPKILPHLLKKRNRPFRIFYETHNFFHDLSLRDDLQRKKSFSLRKTAMQEKMGLKKIDGLICLTHTLQELWQRYVNLPIHVVYPGLIEVHLARRNGKTINLAYTGALDKGRGIDRILDMAAHLPSQYKVYLFGGKKKQEVEEMEHTLREKKLDHKVTITGWLTQSELQERLGQMHLGLLPLRDNFFNRYLTAPSKLFDYLSHSLPAVASSLPALDELVAQNNLGMVVDWDQPGMVAREIIKLMDDPARYQQISDQVYTFATQHTWEKRGERIIQKLFS